MKLARAFWSCLLILGLIGIIVLGGCDDDHDTVRDMPDDSVEVVVDGNGVPHVFAPNDADALFTLGFLHARDRFFQMDLLRRLFSGTTAELLGAAALPQDVQLRTLGLRRAAMESLAVVSDQSREWLEAYSAGVNAYLSDPETSLPQAYEALELTKSAVPAWTPLDSLVILKGRAFSSAFDLSDLEFTQALQVFQAVGDQAGFDGTALFFQDLYRSAPFEPSVSIANTPPAPVLSRSRTAAAARIEARQLDYLNDRTQALIRDYKSSIATVPVLQRALQRRDSTEGSNWWVAAGAITESGYALLANDPHLALDTPAVFYEVHLHVNDDMHVFGVSFPGIPGITSGCNTAICWGSTTNAMDVTDVYQEQLLLAPQTGFPTHTVFDGEPEPLVAIPQTFLLNAIGDGVPDNLVDAAIAPLQGGLTFVVPRRNNGPLVSIDANDPATASGLSVQYTGWRATREIETIRLWARAHNLDDFVAALQFFDVGSQNIAYADIHGNIAYFASGEMPIREDLQTLGIAAGGIPPFFIRDGTHALPHEWLTVENPQPNQSLAFEILPFAEMPQQINPARGFIINANNDPIGATLDNDPLNQTRSAGGLYYLSPGYAAGFRMGRLQRLFDTALANNGTLSVADFKAFQANNQLLDAEILTPYIVQAFDNATAPTAPAPLAALAADPDIMEAVQRLTDWDFSTPTGIREGYDAGDDPAALAEPTSAEVDASVAATLYSVWRGQAVRNVIDATLARFGLQGFGPGSMLAMSALRNLLDAFETRQGVGVSGVSFFQVPGVTAPAAARDIVLLQSLGDALDLLSSDVFGAAFNNSVEQADYRWGRLHRVVFDHPLGGPFSIPPAGGLAHLSNDLPGVARAGGFGTVDASAHSARADGVNEFMFGSGPARRFVAHLTADGIVAEQVIPGGQSEAPDSPFYADQLPLWLTNQYHPLNPVSE